MRCLVVDRSTSCPSMAVFEEEVLVCERVWDSEPKRSPEWIAELANTLTARGLSLATFDRFVCGLGPGSFSGIRAGLSALQGMALSGGKPVYGVASAAALALGQASGSECVTVVGDARRNRLWVVTYRVDAEARRVRRLDGKLAKHTADDFLLIPAEELATAVPEDTRVVSSDWVRLSGMLANIFASERLIPQAVFPMASDLGRLALTSPDSCVFEPLPVYLHPAVAVKA